MGKPADHHRLRCVHCHNTETPLWRTGPDGPKTLCNACGVRFKKGKLVLYKDDAGKLTAIKRLDSLPVHIPPPAKKAFRKPVASSPPTSSSCSDPTPPLSVRNPLSETKPLCIGSNNKPRSRARRINAGQLPGRYTISVTPENQDVRRTPSHSPTASVLLPSGSPRLGGTSLNPLLHHIHSVGILFCATAEDRCRAYSRCQLAKIFVANRLSSVSVHLLLSCVKFYCMIF